MKTYCVDLAEINTTFQVVEADSEEEAFQKAVEKRIKHLESQGSYKQCTVSFSKELSTFEI